jgi:hypothetical protein
MPETGQTAQQVTPAGREERLRLRPVRREVLDDPLPARAIWAGVM